MLNYKKVIQKYVTRFPVYWILLLQNECMKLSTMALPINLKTDLSDVCITTVNFK